MHVVDAAYADFVVWTTKDMSIERIHPNAEWLDENLPQLDEFWKTHVAKELKDTAIEGEKEHHRSTLLAKKAEDEGRCPCGQDASGEMIGCDDNDCQHHWFHYACVGLKRAPTKRNGTVRTAEKRKKRKADNFIR